jgi:predicted PurR-regulated permease PerM
MWNRDSPAVRVLPWLLVVVLLLLLVRLLPHGLGHVAPVILSAIVVAAATAPAARALERYRIPRGITVLAIYLVVALVLAGIGVLLVPVVATEIELARGALPEYGRQIQQLIERVAPEQADRISTARLTDTAVEQAGEVLGHAADLVLAAGSLLVQVVLVLVMAYFMVVEADFVQRVVSRFTPPPHRERTLRLLGTIGTKLGRWARAQALLAVFFGVAFGVGLRLLGVRYAGTLGLVGAVLEVVPYLGGAITVGLAILVAGTQSPWLVLWTVLLYTAVVQVESHLVAPTLLGRAAGLHPLVVLVALFAGVEALGIIGALLAVPAAVVVQALLDELYVVEPAPAAGPTPGEPPAGDGHIREEIGAGYP